MTQAINLANFANNLDTSGGLAPSALNAPVPVNRGGTASSTILGAVSVLGPAFYPVGSVYINASVATNPGTLFGFGTWTAFGSGNVPVGAGGGFTAGSTGGSPDTPIVSHSHSANVSDPSHSHDFPYAINTQTVSGGNNQAGFKGGANNVVVTGTNAATTGIGVSINATGGSGSNTNYQPYIVVYMWLRTA